MYDTLKMKYNSAWTSETEKKVPALPSFSIAMSDSTTVDDERHSVHVDPINSNNERLIGAIVSSKPSTIAATEGDCLFPQTSPCLGLRLYFLENFNCKYRSAH